MPPRSTDNKTELASWLGINRTTLYKWMAEPGFPVNPDGSISPFEVGKWFVLRDVVQGAGEFDEEAGDTDDIKYWKIQNLKEQHRERKNKNDQAEGKLIPLDTIQDFHNQLAGSLRNCGDNMQRSGYIEPYRMLSETLDVIETKQGEFFDSSGPLDNPASDES